MSDAPDAPDALTHPDALAYVKPECVKRGRGCGRRTHTPERAHRNMRQDASGASVRQPTHSTLDALAERLARLSWSWTDPERAHLEKHAIASELRRLASDMRRGAA
jgi:hypothetical protein